VVAFGELLLRLSPPGAERLFQSPALRTWFGGAEANVAAGLAVLGTRSAFVTVLPDSPVGDAALAALRADGVDVAHVRRGAGRMGLYFVEPGADLRAMRVVYDRAGSAFSRVDAGAFDWPAALAGAAWLHVTGITAALADGAAACAAEAVRAARAAGVRVSVDLNWRPALWAGRDPRPAVRPIVEGADLLVGNAPAVRAMLGVGPGDAPHADDARALAEAVAAATGAAEVALTRREHLSATEHGWSASRYAAASGAFAASRRYQVRVVDRVGGGDSFVAALLHATLGGRAFDAALAFATAASALKLTIPGDANRVGAAEVDALLASEPDAAASRPGTPA
jgi:2-dehydro-3-deoxygluconokinase